MVEPQPARKNIDGNVIDVSCENQVFSDIKNTSGTVTPVQLDKRLKKIVDMKESYEVLIIQYILMKMCHDRLFSNYWKYIIENTSDCSLFINDTENEGQTKK